MSGEEEKALKSGACDWTRSFVALKKVEEDLNRSCGVRSRRIFIITRRVTVHDCEIACCVWLSTSGNLGKTQLHCRRKVHGHLRMEEMLSEIVEVCIKHVSYSLSAILSLHTLKAVEKFFERQRFPHSIRVTLAEMNPYSWRIDNRARLVL